MMILQHLPDWYYSFFYFPKHFNRQCHYVLHKHCTIQCVLHYQVNILQILQEHQRLSCLFIVALSSEPPSDFVTASKIILFIYCCTIKWTSFRFCDSIKDYPVCFVWENKSEANKLILQFLRGPFSWHFFAYCFISTSYMLFYIRIHETILFAAVSPLLNLKVRFPKGW